MGNLSITYEFVPYGTHFHPQPNTLVLDVGRETKPGVIDHHHPDAPPECTASLLVKKPELVLEHIYPPHHLSPEKLPPLKFITHRFPDFDAIVSLFLAQQIILSQEVVEDMIALADYTKLVDSGALPRTYDLTGTPYAILRALFTRLKVDTEEELNQERIRIGLQFIRFIYEKLREGYDVFDNRSFYQGTGAYEKVIKLIENDYFSYLQDLRRSQAFLIDLPSPGVEQLKRIDVLLIRDPASILLKEWARRDRNHSPLHQGFGLLISGTKHGRYMLGVAPEKGVHLKGLAPILNDREKKKRELVGRSFVPWYDGNCPLFNFRIIAGPQDGSELSFNDLIESLRSYQRVLHQDFPTKRKP